MAQSKHSTEVALLNKMCETTRPEAMGSCGAWNWRECRPSKGLTFCFYLNTPRQIFLDSRFSPWVINL